MTITAAEQITTPAIPAEELEAIPTRDYEGMDPILKKKWLDAMRSGEYERIKAVLVGYQKENQYCALGLLNHVAGAKDERSYVLPKKVLGGGMDETCAPKGRGGRGMSDIYRFNDHFAESWEDVARFVEENF